MDDQTQPLELTYDKQYKRKDGKPGKNYREVIVDGKLFYEFEPKPGKAAPLFDRPGRVQ